MEGVGDGTKDGVDIKNCSNFLNFKLNTDFFFSRGKGDGLLMPMSNSQKNSWFKNSLKNGR